MNTLVINGPTASGKTDLAVEVALKLQRRGQDAQIVNADSMLVYRNMDIGTAKPSLAERKGVVHHLIDIMDVTQNASVAVFRDMARDIIAQIRQQNMVPIVVGGSALYTHAIVDVVDFPGTDPAVRARLETELEQVGPEVLYQRLLQLNPKAASGILPGNGRRIVRALEVIEITGDFVSTLPQWEYALPDVIQFGLDIERPLLDQRIELRVDKMWEQGLVAEVEYLKTVGIESGVTASRALGYKQVLAFLRGEISEAEAKEATKSGTRKFARKQLSWLRRDPRIQWLDHLNPLNAQIIADNAI